MKRLGLLFLLLALLWAPSVARADWRWAKPNLKPQTIKYHCASLECIKHTYSKERKRLKRRIAYYNRRRLNEWKYWSRLYIPSCTWYGESGTGAQYARYRYTLPNSTGSGAYGKYQMMPGTYHSRAKYHDWSPLDQEIAGHKEYWANGTGPWTNCH